jgi:translational activator of cytochrome c oxidase 1
MLSQLLRSVALSRHQSRLLSLSIPLSKGHSKWQNIKDIKGRNDSIRARSITFLLAKAKTAIKQGGFDVKTNLSLSKIQQEFREKGLPLDSFNKFLIKMKVIEF